MSLATWDEIAEAIVAYLPLYTKYRDLTVAGDRISRDVLILEDISEMQTQAVYVAPAEPEVANSSNASIAMNYNIDIMCAKYAPNDDLIEKDKVNVLVEDIFHALLKVPMAKVPWHSVQAFVPAEHDVIQTTGVVAGFLTMRYRLDPTMPGESPTLASAASRGNLTRASLAERFGGNRR